MPSSRPIQLSTSDRTGQENVDEESHLPGSARQRLLAAPPKTIGVLADYMNASGSAYEAHIRDAIDARCRELGHHLLVIYGRALDDPAPASAPHNAIFSAISNEVVDGVLLISSCLAAHSGVEGLRRLAVRCGSLPVCSIGIEVPGVPSIVADNVPGMAAVIEHLIVEHDCRRIAFIAGTPDNPEAKVRFDVYQDVLRRHGLAFDPQLVGYGAFSKEHAYKALVAVLAQGACPDAVVAANDAMAAGAIQALRESHRRIPRDVLVTGFDDMPFARIGNPPLTTVRQPLEAMASMAVDTVLELIAGRSVPGCTCLPTEIVVRRSCGCQAPGSAGESPRRSAAGCTAVAYVSQHAPHLKQALVNRLRTGLADPAPDAERLIGALTRELQGTPGAFMRVVEELAEERVGDFDRGRALQLALIALRQELAEVNTLELEAIWYDAATAVALANGASPALERLTIDERTFRLIGSGEQISMALDFAALEQVLVRLLPQLGISTALLTRYASADATELEPLACLVRGEDVTPRISRYPARRMLPVRTLTEDQRRTLLVYPIAYEGEPLGVAAFEYDDKVVGYNTLMAQISVAVRNIALHQQIVRKTILHERSVQERLATTKRLDALSILAGGVAHDLNNALSPMLALSEIVLRELAQLNLPEGPPGELIADVDVIRTASLHAAQTIKDLLTLGRQGRLVKCALDLNGLLASCNSSTLRALRDAKPQLDVSLELASEPLVVLGSAAQLERAISNLIHNAVDAVGGCGQLRIATARATLKQPLLAYERIEAGDYAVITVSDDGTGIEASELTRLFEPFFSKKRASERAGSGLGLAIVHGVVKEHAGYVDVTSDLGKGTTFTLYVPLTSEPARVSLQPVAVRRGKARVLIIDDDALLLRTGLRVLKPLGYQVVTCDSGKRALEQFTQAAGGACPHDLVIVDMILNEELDGLQLLERIRDLFPGLKAILASGNAGNRRVEAAVHGGLTWLPKPYTADALARSVQLALEV